MAKNLVITFIAFLIANTTALATNVNPTLAKIEQILDICIYSSIHTPYNKNCSKAGMRVVDANPKATNLVWDYAQIVRRKMGNAPALEYYDLALSRKTNEERCIDDGLDIAVQWGLKQSPTRYGKEIKHATDIVFKQCWAVWKEDIVNQAKSKTNELWLNNVCKALKNIEQPTLINKCS